MKQLDGHLKKFLSKKRKLSKPEYYILATNVALSGVAESGGRDRTMKVLEDYSPKLRLKRHAIYFPMPNRFGSASLQNAPRKPNDTKLKALKRNRKVEMRNRVSYPKTQSIWSRDTAAT